MRAMTFALLIGLAACTQAQPPPPAPPAVPAYLSTCPPAVPIPPPPGKPRTVEAIAAWANRTDLALHDANRRLAICNAHRASLASLLAPAQ